MMHPPPQNNSWHLLMWAPCLHLLSCLFAHRLSFSLLLLLPVTAGLARSLARSLGLAQMGESSRCFIRQFFVVASPPPPCLFLPFLAFAHLSHCRMDLGCEVNEVICICPKLFAVDCFEERTTGRGNGTTLLPERRKFTFFNQASEKLDP